MLSCQYERNVIDGKKKIILNPGEQQKRDVPNESFGENEVYGIDILVVSAADGKVSRNLVSVLGFNRETEPLRGFEMHDLSTLTRGQLSA